MSVRVARVEELPLLEAIEDAADALFGPDLPEGGTAPDVAEALRVLVVGDPPVGFARLDLVDGQPHLEALAVHPDAQRRGLGRELVLAGLAWARAEGFRALTLCTFRDLPFNGPFYASCGFTELPELTPGLRERREHERALGLDALGVRVVMACRLSLGSTP